MGDTYLEHGSTIKRQDYSQILVSLTHQEVAPLRNALLNAKTKKHGRNIRCLAIRHIREQMRLRQSYLRMDLFKQVSQCIMISCPTNQEFIDMYQEEQWEDMLLL